MSNFCISGMMASCSAGEIWREHSRCKYAKPSSNKDRCMFYYDDGTDHCDCLEAQIDDHNLRLQAS